MGQFEGKVAFITGGARGQGRSHALTLAKGGADIVLFDAPSQPAISYPTATVEELKQTEADVIALGGRCIAVEGDVRDLQSVSETVERGINELGHIDILVANAGVSGYGSIDRMSEESWNTVVDINLTGVWNSIHSVAGHMMERKSGRIIATSSTMGRMGARNASNYAASKWGVIGLVKSVALETAEAGVTANVVCPTAVKTPLIQNDETYRLFRPDLESPTWDDCEAGFASLIPMGVSHIDAEDVSNVVAFLASDAARYITGAVLDVTGGKSALWTA